jgi:uncharacterized protein YdcH (DUF465 family)
MHRHFLRALLPAALLALALCPGPTIAKDSKDPVVEVAICLDTSSSMDGLITSAKKKLWDIVNDLARAKPTPKLRVAVFSYGNNAYDPKTGWVRQELDLTDDLDRVSEKLNALRATTIQGGDEYVGRVCRDAVEKLKWSDDAKALKVVFVCGNEKADQDPEVKLADLAQAAVRKNIYLNTIYCGSPLSAEAVVWKDFARLGEGRFAAIDQNQGVVAIAAPQDKQLAELSAQLNVTFCFAGKGAKDAAENQRRQDDNALRLGAPAAAARAESKAGGLYRFDGIDLVERLRQDGKFDVKKLAEDELPDELKKMKPAERDAHIRGLLLKRETLEKQINELAQQRQVYIEAELKKQPSAADRAFDTAVRGALRDQAKQKGIVIPK